ncbi:uncharacterized protein LOC118741025 [Rhagoletis pomonella]|uniref:uncharacterized protein LOC118741025 n=1 Tax=Rhagoletis pomonella TaxID=28610 RepID=UPI00177DA992|nr:uncharacterized protein LOC118741025 [Rhagoletis pomonella]XP_036328708.1 uncharacterized protein LOC118741025 [Rhagoletis pomonella]XP_036328709.1 uncharacterized protein LOC118741025 [Rhagoletis pomonella]
MRRTPKSRKSTKLENSLWHYQKFFRELKQRRIEFMQQKIYRKFRFGIIYSDCLVAAEAEQQKQQQQETRYAVTQAQAQTQTQLQNLKQKQGQVQVGVAVAAVNCSYTQRANQLRGTKRNRVKKATNTTTIRKFAASSTKTTNAAYRKLHSSQSTAASKLRRRTSATTDTQTQPQPQPLTKRRYGNRRTKLMPTLAYALRMPLKPTTSAAQRMLVNV